MGFSRNLSEHVRLPVYGSQEMFLSSDSECERGVSEEFYDLILQEIRIPFSSPASDLPPPLSCPHVAAHAKVSSQIV